MSPGRIRHGLTEVAENINLLLTMILQLVEVSPVQGLQAGGNLGAISMGADWTVPTGHTPFDLSSTTEHSADQLVAACLAAAAAGELSAYFDLGVAYSTGSHGAPVDLIEAHKWFNLAAVAGYEDAAQCRADVSEEMTAREVAEAQRRAREWLAAGARRAA